MPAPAGKDADPKEYQRYFEGRGRRQAVIGARHSRWNVARRATSMQRRHVELWAPGIDAHGVLLAYGQWGRPVLVFPTERGRAWEYENGGMVDAVAGLVEAGRTKLYFVGPYDRGPWAETPAPVGG